MKRQTNAHIPRATRVFGGALLTAGLAWPAIAQPAFTTQDIPTDLGGPGDVFAADINGDGHLDLVVAEFDDDRVRWYESNGAADPTFTPRDVYLGSNEPLLVFAADLDGDTDIDIISVSSYDDVIRWHENDGAAASSFTTQTLFSSPALIDVSGLFAADINGDGHTDIITATPQDDTVRWLENDGAADPGFTPREVSNTTPFVTEVFAADIDGDGLMDVVSTGLFDGTVRWFKSDGAPVPSFTPRTIYTNAASQFTSIFAADVDGDTDVDIVVGSQSDDALRWLESDGAAIPSFTPRDILTAAGAPSDVIAADIDGDSDTDVVAAYFSANTIRWFENDGAANPLFTQRSVSAAVNGTSALFAADVDADGDTDILSVEVVDDLIRWHESDGASAAMPPEVENLSVMTTHPTIADGIAAAGSGQLLLATESRFAAEPMIDFGGKAISLRSRGSITQDPGAVYTLADDALLDTAAGRTLQLGAATVVLAAPGHVAFSGRTILPSDINTFAQTDVNAGTFELRPDGVLEMGEYGVLYVTAPGGSRVEGTLDLAEGGAVWFRDDAVLDAQTSFDTSDISTVAQAPYSVFAIDLDGDDDLDVLSASAGDNAIRWYESDGQPDPTFTPIDIFTNATAAWSVFAADLDGDGDVDVVSCSSGDDAVRWYENDGQPDPTFTAHDITTSALAARGVYAADVNGDGHVDVVSASADDSTVRWYENDGAVDPTFTPRVVSSAVGGAWDVIAVDLDGDTDMDILSAGLFDETFRWHENEGGPNPSFTTHTLLVDGEAFSIKAADIDGDSDLDVVTSSFDNVIRWLENDGAADPAFTSQTVFANPGFDNASGVFAADFDGDGDTDVVSAYLFGNVIRLHENDGAADPSFATRDIFTNAQFAVDVFGVDLDGDADIDVLSASQNDNGLRWHENTSSLTLDEFGALAGDETIINEGALRMNGGIIFAPDGAFVNRGVLSGWGEFDTNMTNDGAVTLGIDRASFLSGSYTNNGTTELQGVPLGATQLVNNGVIVVHDDSLGARTLFQSTASSELRMFGLNARLIPGEWFDVAINDSARFDLSSAKMSLGGATPPARIETMSRDIGPSAAGLDRTLPGHYPIGRFELSFFQGPFSRTVDLVDNHDNDGLGQTQCEAIYVRELVIEAGTTLNTNGCLIYYETGTIAGTVDDPANLIQIPPSPCPGDVDGDGDTDVFDFAELAANFGAGPGATRGQGDLTGDGFVNVFDFANLAGDFGCGSN